MQVVSQAAPCILIIRLKSMGDVLFTLPAVHALRENFPEARLHFLVSRENAPLLRGFAEVDEVIALDRAVYASRQAGAMIHATGKLLRRLRRPKFSRVIDFQGFGETELMSWWTGAPERWGCVYHPPRGWLYTRGIERNDQLHPADWNLSLLEQCGLRVGPVRNEFILPGDALDEARKLFADNKLDVTRPTLFIQPFTSSPHKNWPLENYLALAAHWRARETQVIFGGGPGDRAALEPVRRAGFVTSAGAPLLASAGLLCLSTVVVGGITGLLHLAVAMRKRVIALVGYPNREPGFPYQHRDWAVISPSGGPVAEIPLAAIIAACEQVFRR